MLGAGGVTAWLELYPLLWELLTVSFMYKHLFHVDTHTWEVLLICSQAPHKQGQNLTQSHTAQAQQLIPPRIPT